MTCYISTCKYGIHNKMYRRVCGFSIRTKFRYAPECVYEYNIPTPIRGVDIKHISVVANTYVLYYDIIVRDGRGWQIIWTLRAKSHLLFFFIFFFLRACDEKYYTYIFFLILNIVRKKLSSNPLLLQGMKKKLFGKCKVFINFSKV